MNDGDVKMYGHACVYLDYGNMGKMAHERMVETRLSSPHPLLGQPGIRS